MGVPIRSQQASRAHRYTISRHSQEASNLPSLVSSRDCSAILLELVQRQDVHGPHLLCDELCCAWHHVFLLFLDGSEAKAEVAQPDVDHLCSDRTDVRGSIGDSNEHIFQER